MHDGIRASGRYKIREFLPGTKVCTWESPWIPNKVVSTSGYGRNLIVRRLAGDETYGSEIDSAAIGTGSAAPTDADVALGAAVLSGIAITEAVVSNDELTLNIFITDSALADGTYNEFGLFIGGRLFARSLIVPAYAKTANRDTTVEYVVTLT